MSRDDTEIGSSPSNPDPFRIESLTGQVLDERYAVEELLGEGAMGAVFRARQIRLRRTVALKVPKPHLLGNEEFMGRFEREALTMAKLVHENIVQIFDVCVSIDPAVPSFIVMEYIEGAELEKFLRTQEHSLTVAALVDIFAQIARGLDAAHARGVVHRDIKPSNIVVTMPHRVPKIMDFGIARIQMENAFATQDAAVIGTPAYMAPEQVKGLTVTPAADIYAFGMMVYRLLSRQLPFNADTQTALLYAHVQEEPIPIHERNHGIPPQLWDALKPALAKKPTDRPPSAALFIEGVEKALEPISQRAFAELFSGVSGTKLESMALDRDAATVQQPAPPSEPAAPPPPSAPARKPALYFLIGGLVAAACLLLFAVAAVMVVNRLRAEPEPQPPPPANVVAVATAAPKPEPTPTSAPPVRRTPAPTPAAAPTAVPRTPVPTPVPTPQPTPAPIIERIEQAIEVVAPPPAPTPTLAPTPTPVPARDDPRWNADRNPPATPESLQLRYRNQIDQFADEKIEIPTTRGQFDPEENALVALGNDDARRLASFIQRASAGPFTQVALTLNIQHDKSHYWASHAYAVFDISVTGRPTKGRRSREIVGILRGDDTVEMWLVLKDEKWELVDMRIRWSESQRLTEEIEP